MGGRAIDPKIATANMIKAGAKPLVPFTKKRDPWRSQCLSCKRIITPSYGNVINGHAACKFCAKGGVSESEALSILKNAKAKPRVPYPGFKKPWKSECLICHRMIQPRLNVIVRSGNACNFCNRRAVDPQEADRIARKSGAIPQVPYPGAGRWECQCKTCKRIIFPTLRRMRNGQNPCGWCAGVRIDPSEARDAYLQAGLKAIGKYPGANKAWDAQCTSCGRRVTRSLARIKAGRYACPYCSGRKLTNADATKILRAAGARPLEKYVSIYAKWKSQCLTCFREISPSLANVRDGHSPCVYCSGKKVDAVTAKEFALSRGLDPIGKYPGATKRWKVRCLKCQRTSSVSWVTLQLKRKNAGCSSCTIFGFKPLEPTYLYVITHKQKKAHKIGIGNANARRIEKHVSNGWQIKEVLLFKKGTVAHKVEQEVIEWFRTELNLGPAYRNGDGWTETVPSNEIDVISIVKKVRKLSDNKGEKISPQRFAA